MYLSRRMSIERPRVVAHFSFWSLIAALFNPSLQCPAGYYYPTIDSTRHLVLQDSHKLAWTYSANCQSCCSGHRKTTRMRNLITPLYVFVLLFTSSFHSAVCHRPARYKIRSRHQQPVAIKVQVKLDHEGSVLKHSDGKSLHYTSRARNCLFRNRYSCLIY